MHNLANSYRLQGRRDDAIRLYEETLGLQQAKIGPDHPHTLLTMANLATCYADHGRHEEALRLREETLALQQRKLGSDHPETLMSMYNLANSYTVLGRHEDALRLHEETLTLRKTKIGADHADTLNSLSTVARALVRLDRVADAVKVIDEYVARAAGKARNSDLVPELMDTRLRHFEKIRDPGGCRATAEMWEKLGRSDADGLYNAACYRAITAAVVRATDRSPAAAEQAAAEADRAIAWLTRAVAAGYKDVANMKKDKDLDALREREDFRALLKDMEAGVQKK
jgi:tetratricopeptide (TPR) repeat protein